MKTFILIAVFMNGTPLIKNGLTKIECEKKVITLSINNRFKSIACKPYKEWSF